MSQEKFFEYARRLASEEKRSRDQWAKVLSVTIRTINNFNLRLEKEFGIVVIKNHQKPSYYFIDRAKSRRYEEFINFINNLNSPSKIAESFDSASEFGKHLIFHQNWDKIAWMRHFNDLVNAINSQRHITLTCTNYRQGNKVETIHNFKPYWMKQNAYYRWYIIGFESEAATFPRVIGCDKILSLKVEELGFLRKKELEDFRDDYEKAFGVYIYPDRPTELVRLECTRFQASYLKSMPLHISQVIESENEEVTIFRYHLQINHEFAFELLRQNVWNFNVSMLLNAHPQRTALKVLEPAWLADYFHQTYKRSYMAYCENASAREELRHDIETAPIPYPLPEF